MRQATRQVFWSSSLLCNSSPKNNTYHGNSYQKNHFFHVVLAIYPDTWDFIRTTSVNTGPFRFMGDMSRMFSPLSGQVALAGIIHEEIGVYINPNQLPRALPEQTVRQYFGTGFDNCPQMSAAVWKQEWLE